MKEQAIIKAKDKGQSEPKTIDFSFETDKTDPSEVEWLIAKRLCLALRDNEIYDLDWLKIEKKYKLSNHIDVGSVYMQAELSNLLNWKNTYDPQRRPHRQH